MDHIKEARNFRHDLEAQRTAEIDNPLCGDTMNVYVRLGEEGALDAVSFHCECCGIAMASASIMTQAVQGLTVAQAEECASAFAAAIDSGSVDRVDGIDGAHVAVLLAVAATPSRKMCAKLGWLGLAKALETHVSDAHDR